MKEKETSFEDIYRKSLSSLEKIDIVSTTNILGLEYRGDELQVLFYGMPYAVSPIFHQ